MGDTRRLRRVTSKSRGDDTRNIYRRYQLKNGKEEPVPTGRATAYVVIINHKGRQFRRFAPTQAAAIRERDELRQLIREGVDPAGQAVTFAAYADGWLERYKGKSGGIRAETKREYKSELEHAKLYFKGRKLASIKRRDAEHYIEHVRETRGRGGKPASDGTIRNAIAPLRALFFDALHNEIVRSNPFSRIAVRGVVEEEDANTHTGQDEVASQRHLEPTELRKFLACLGEPQEAKDPDEPTKRWDPGYSRLLGEFLAQTGLRISEAVALRWEDVDFTTSEDKPQPTVRVEWRIYRGKRGRPKSANARREVPISPGIATQLEELRVSTRFKEDHQPVFASSRGTHLEPSNVYKRVFKPAFVKAGVPWAGFHALRHTAASFYFRAATEGGAQANVLQVSRLLGHHAPGFTLNTYIHLFNENKLANAAPFDAFIKDGSKNGSRTDLHRAVKPTKKRATQKRQTAGTSKKAA